MSRQPTDGAAGADREPEACGPPATVFLRLRSTGSRKATDLLGWGAGNG
jgi:hypothetical protein